MDTRFQFVYLGAERAQNRQVEIYWTIPNHTSPQIRDDGFSEAVQ